jgi:acetyltransferase-like isoleucine patch superfamily enzyme
VGIDSEVSASQVGRSTYIASNSSIQCAKIGRFCAIGDNVRICLGNHPSKTIVSIHPCFYSTYGQGSPEYLNRQIFEQHKYIDYEKKYVVEIGNDVWIGNNVNIMDGITIGDGAIIGLGAVVTRDVDPYSIVTGIPARHLRYRFDEKQMQFLLKFRWWNKDEEWIKKNSHLFSDINIFMEKYNNT